MPAYLVEHNKTSQTGKIRKIRTTKTKKPTGVLKNVTQDQKGCNKNICAEEEQITAARAKQHEDEEEDTGINKVEKDKKKKKKKKSRQEF